MSVDLVRRRRRRSKETRPVNRPRGAISMALDRLFDVKKMDTERNKRPPPPHCSLRFSTKHVCVLMSWR